MGQNIQSGLTSVTGVVTAVTKLPGNNATQVTREIGTKAGTGAKATYATITAGKTGYVYGIVLTGTANDSVPIYFSDNTTIALYCRYLANTTTVITFPYPIKYPESTPISYTAAASSNVTILFWEE